MTPERLRTIIERHDSEVPRLGWVMASHAHAHNDRGELIELLRTADQGG